uniref:Calcineurin-like phosphoesterase domain-containing protein n=1 Tax=viral metagenome TaxID=1070528 RepID=A0A6C0LTQ6_9ZZZZ
MLSKVKNLHGFCKVKTNYEFTHPQLQFISDIHLEYRDKYPIIPQQGNYLALLGDIGNPFKNNYADFIKYSAHHWNKVFLITGNHEYWQKNYTIEDTNDKVSTICSKYNNVYFLNNSHHCLNDDYDIVGSTLWSNVKHVSVALGYSQYSRNIHPSTTNKLHHECVDFLNNIISNSQKKLIIITHHMPSFLLINKNYKNSINNDRYASNLDYLIRKPIQYWLCGHSHYRTKVRINDILCIINPLGYENSKRLKKSEIQSILTETILLE